MNVPTYIDCAKWFWRFNWRSHPSQLLIFSHSKAYIRYMKDARHVLFPLRDVTEVVVHMGELKQISSISGDNTSTMQKVVES